MNFVPCTKTGGRLTLGADVHAPAEGAAARIPDGRYLAGFRANHLGIARHAPGAVEFRCTLGVSEITGAETFLHLDHAGADWVALVHGVHDMAPGAEIGIWLDPAHVYLFADDGRLAAPAPYAAGGA
jgi:glycerol transport system ATP-binding protein